MNKEFLDPNTRYSDQKVDLAKMPRLVGEFNQRITALEEGGGGGDGNNLILNLTQGEPVPVPGLAIYTVDKTSEEIYNAITASPETRVLAFIGTTMFEATSIDMKDSRIYFSQAYNVAENEAELDILVVSFGDEEAKGFRNAVSLDGGGTETPLNTIVFRIYTANDGTGTFNRITNGEGMDSQIGPTYTYMGTYPRRGSQATDPPVNVLLFEGSPKNKIVEPDTVTLVSGQQYQPTYEYTFDISYLASSEGYTQLKIKFKPQGTNWRVDQAGVQGTT